MNTEFFTTDVGVKLAYFAKYVKGSKIGVIIIHGLAEHKGRYEYFINRLVDSSISVFAVDLRGHGESDGRRGDIGCFDEYLADLDAFVRHIKNTHPDLKLALFGHSMGGLIVTAYVAESNLADMLILSSPSLKTPGLLQILRIMPNGICKKVRIKKIWSESKDMMKYSRSDPLACNYLTLRLMRAAFIDGVRSIAKNYKNITAPVLMLGGKRDNTVDSGKFKSILNRFASPDKTLITYENAIHRVVQNAAKEKSVSDIISWLKERA